MLPLSLRLHLSQASPRLTHARFAAFLCPVLTLLAALASLSGCPFRSDVRLPLHLRGPFRHLLFTQNELASALAGFSHVPLQSR